MNFKRMLSVVECHAEGENGKVIVGGVGQVAGATMFEKKLYLEEHMDDIRKLVLFEPRGAVWHNANIVLPSHHPEADMGFVILETTEYPAMSGSNTICVATVLLETGILPMQEPVTYLTLEAPAGLIKVRCQCLNGKVTSVRLVNQPAFCYHLDQYIEVNGIGAVRISIVYGGMTFVMVEAAELGFDIHPSEARSLCELGQKLKWRLQNSSLSSILKILVYPASLMRCSWDQCTKKTDSFYRRIALWFRRDDATAPHVEQGRQRVWHFCTPKA